MPKFPQPKNDIVESAALNILDDMHTIVKNEQVHPGKYVSEDVTSPELKEAGAICGGRQACAIGSLYIAAGVKPRWRDGNFALPGVAQQNRERYMKIRPGLKLAYDELNAAAERYIVRHDVHANRLSRYFDSPLEQLFEGINDFGRRELLRVISSAKLAIRAAD